MFCGFFNLFLFILWRVLCAFRTLSRCPTFRIKSPTLLTSISLLLLKVWQTWVGGKSEIASSILWHHHNFQALCSGLLLLPLCPDCLSEKEAELLLLPAGCAAMCQAGNAPLLPLRRVPEGSPCTGRGHGAWNERICVGSRWAQPHLMTLLTTRSKCFSCRRAESWKWAAWCYSTHSFSMKSQSS